MSDQFLTVKQVMSQLGVSRQTVHSLAHQYKWASELTGNKRRYKASDVVATPDEAERRRLGYVQRSLDAGIPQWFYAKRDQQWLLVSAESQAAARHLAERALGELPQVCRLARAAEVDAYADQAGAAQILADPIVLTEQGGG